MGLAHIDYYICICTLRYSIELLIPIFYIFIFSSKIFLLKMNDQRANLAHRHSPDLLWSEQLLELFSATSCFTFDLNVKRMKIDKKNT